MAEENLDCIITQNHCAIFDSGIRYFVDEQTGGYSSSLLIPKAGKMVYLMSGPDNENAPVQKRNVARVVTKPYCLPFHFTDTLAAAVMEEELRARSCKRVGFWGLQFISYSFGQYLTKILPDVEFIDFSDRVQEILSVKSEEEWTLIHKSLRIHEQLIAALPALIKPGRKEYEVRADLVGIALQLGADYIGNLSLGSAPAGEMSKFVQNYSANRTLEPGDTITAMIEIAGPGGMYCELARTFVLGEPTQDLLELNRIAREVQALVATHAKPGVTGGELNRVFDDYVTQFGIAPNKRFVGHGQGYDMMESPAICAAESMALKENMYFAIHPELTRNGIFAIACDNYRITKAGAIRLTRTPQDIIVVDW